jgi:hypothetical protein
VYFIAFDVLNLVDCMLNGCEGLLLHLSGSHLGTFGRHSILLVLSVEISCEVIEIFLLDTGIHLFRFKHQDVLKIIGVWLHRVFLLDPNTHCRLLVGIESILENFQTKEVFHSEVIEKHLHQAHRRLKNLRIWETTDIKQNLDALFFNVVPRN